jgi:bacteriorhodopsin
LNKAGLDSGRPFFIASAIVVFVAGYHYFRIFGSWEAAYQISSDGLSYLPTGQPFNDAYRYVDWLITVPLLMVELVLVLALSRELTRLSQLEAKNGNFLGRKVRRSA